MQLARFALLTAALSLVLAPSAVASHSFTDVPDAHAFHTEIGIFKATNITTGCTATTFCPDGFVKRQAMAAFIDRALGLVVRSGETTQKGVPSSRVATLDDDLSFAGTEANAFRYRGQGTAVLEVVGGEGQFEHASGRIASTFLLSDTGELTDNHFGLLFVAADGGGEPQPDFGPGLRRRSGPKWPQPSTGLTASVPRGDSRVVRQSMKAPDAV